MNCELSEIEVEAQLRQKMVEQLLPFGVQLPATRRDQRRYVSDEDLVVAVLKVISCEKGQQIRWCYIAMLWLVFMLSGHQSRNRKNRRKSYRPGIWKNYATESP